MSTFETFYIFLQDWVPRCLVALTIAVVLQMVQKTDEGQGHRLEDRQNKSRLLVHEPIAATTADSISNNRKPVEESDQDKSSIVDGVEQQNDSIEESPSDFAAEQTSTTEPDLNQNEEDSRMTEDDDQPDGLEPPSNDQSRDLGGSSPQVPAPTVANRTSSTALPPRSRAPKQKYPLEAFCHWYNTEASLYRCYEVGRTDDKPVVVPYIPNSKRGQVDVSLVVANQTRHTIHVYWVDYKGREVSKGRIRHGSIWTQRTWIEHPWVFKLDEESWGNDSTPPPVLLHFCPYRIIPTTTQNPTVDPSDPSVGLFRFILKQPCVRAQDDFHICSVDDPIMPYPAQHHVTSCEKAIECTLNHLNRFNNHSDNDMAGVQRVEKYLMNILKAPHETKYRRIRVGNASFHDVWNTPLRGILLAVGFVEHLGYADFLSHQDTISYADIQQISKALWQIKDWREKAQEENQETEQPLGADGFGRAGYSRPGSSNPWA